jgi:serine/threonine-protein kinase
VGANVSVDELFGYKVIAFLGQGARSKLYAVKDRGNGETYALKHVVYDERMGDKDDRFLRQVVNEYTTLREIEHPSLRRVIALKRLTPLFQVTEVALVLELIDSATIEEEPPRMLGEYLRIFSEVAEGLAHLHSHKFVHADMKLGNIMLPSPEPTPHCSKIIDLGQSCKSGTIKERTQGSPGYMAPEQAAREPITEQTDIYNFGATMYRALVRNYAETVLVPGEKKPRRPEQVPASMPPAERVPGLDSDLSDLVMECLQLQPHRRPRSMTVVAEALRRIEASSTNMAV